MIHLRSIVFVSLILIASRLGADSYMTPYFSTLNQNYNIMPPDLRRAMQESEQRLAAKGESSSSSQSQSAPSPDAPGEDRELATTLAKCHFKQEPAERSKIIAVVVNGLPESLGREKHRALVDAVSEKIEHELPEADRQNLAKITYLVVAASLQNATGRTLSAEKAQILVRAISQAYAQNEAFQRLDDHARSQMYYLFLATTALEMELVYSADPIDKKAGLAIAQGVLRYFKISSD